MRFFDRFRWGRRSVADREVVIRPLDMQTLYELATGEAWDEQSALTPEAAMKVSPVAAGVNFIAESIASLPMYLYKRVGRGKDAKVERVGGAVEEIINRYWTEDEDAHTGMSWTMRQKLFRGAGYIFVDRNASGRILSLRALHPSNINPQWINGRKVYQFTPNQYMAGETRNYGVRDIIEIAHRYSVDGNWERPISFLQDASNSIRLYSAIDRYSGNFFNAGGVPPLVVQAPLGSEKAGARMKEDIGKRIMKTNRRGELVMVLPFGHEVKDIGVDPQKSQMVPAKLYQLTEIARHLTLPPIFLQDLSKGTYANSEQQAMHVVKHFFRPLGRYIESRFNLSLFGRGSRYFVMLDLDELLRGDTATRYNAWARGIQAGMLTPNEARGKESLPQSTDPEADKLHMQQGTGPLDGGENNDPDPGNNNPPPNPDPTGDPDE